MADDFRLLVEGKMTDRFTAAERSTVASAIRDWIHEQPWSLCNAGCDACPDWEKAYEIRDVALGALEPEEERRVCGFCGLDIDADEKVIQARTGNGWAHVTCWYDSGPFEREVRGLGRRRSDRVASAPVHREEEIPERAWCVLVYCGGVITSILGPFATRAAAEAKGVSIMRFSDSEVFRVEIQPMTAPA